jgi:IS30 family transposase
MTMRAGKGEVSRAERIRELHAKGYPIEAISQRMQLKQSAIKREIDKVAK